MTTGKKIAALTILIIAGFGIVYLIQSQQLNKANNGLQQPELVNGLLAEPANEGGMTYLVPQNRVFDYGVEVEEIRDPKFVSVSEADIVLADDIPGIDVEVEGDHYFFSYQIMNWHQLAELEAGGKTITVTYDPLCYSDRVFETSGLSHSNQVYDNNAVLSDEDGNLWSQIRGSAIAGDRAGEELPRYPYISMTWGEWKERHPDGLALSTETGFNFDYTRHPFGAYDENDFIYFPLSNLDERMDEKAVVDGLVLNNDAIGFVRIVEKGFIAANVEVGGEPVVGIYDSELDLTRAFSAEVDGQVLTFVWNFDDEQLTDEQTGSEWNLEGAAIDGELEGAQLESIPTMQQSWMCWGATRPDAPFAHESNIETVEDEGTDIEIDLSE